MARFVGLDVSQKLTSICVVDDAGRRLWRGQCNSEPEPIERRRHAGDDASIGIETGPMTPWLVHELRGRGLACRTWSSAATHGVNCYTLRMSGHAILCSPISSSFTGPRIRMP